jgi:hypothetical protein
MKTFYLGTCKPQWLGKTDVPLFLSRRSLSEWETWKRARGQWALDSGAFTELQMYGRYKTKASQYAAEASVYHDMIGPFDFASVMDWMCEPFMIEKTGLSVLEHQQRTIDSYLELTTLEPTLPWLPVLQGFETGEYLDHAEMYDRAGIDLRNLPRVGVGSICRRQKESSGVEILKALSRLKLKLHGFGLKTLGLEKAQDCVVSADSMAWAITAWRKKIQLPGCTHNNCANCLKWALQWRQKLLGNLERRTG